MAQDVIVVAARVLERVGQDGKAVEGAVVIDALGEGDDRGGAPGGIDSWLRPG